MLYVAVVEGFTVREDARFESNQSAWICEITPKDDIGENR